MGPYCKYCDTRCFVHNPRKAGHLLATCLKGQQHDRRVLGYDYDSIQAEKQAQAAAEQARTGLNSAALEMLHAANISPAEWRTWNRMGATWTGDACGCPDDRCIGSHHSGPDDCGCLPALLETKRLEEAVSTARSNSHGCRRGCLDGECYCAEPTYAEMNDVCAGCGGHDGDCYCGKG